MTRYFYRIATVDFKVTLPAVPKVFKSPLYQKFQIKNNRPDFGLFFEEIEKKQDIYPFSFLSPGKIASLRKTISWSPRWEKNRILHSRQLVNKLTGALDRPGWTQVMLAFNRVVVRDFQNKQIYYLYPQGQEKIFVDMDFRAMYRNLIAPFFVLFYGLLLHGGAVTHDQQSIVFHAPDEGGKTTFALNFESSCILSDDQVAIREEDDDFRIYGTPFGTMGGKTGPCRLGAILMLEKSKNFRIEPVSPTVLIEFLWNEHKMIWMFLPIELRKRAFQLLADYCYSAPVYRLYFPRQGIDRDKILSLLV